MHTHIYFYMISLILHSIRRGSISFFVVGLLFLMSCNETAIIEAGKSKFGIQGELEQCLADSIKLYETDGFAIHQIRAVPLVKSGSFATFKFVGRIPQKGFYLIGTSLNNLLPILLGGEEDIKLVGNGTSFSRMIQIQNSPQNENYAKLRTQIMTLNQMGDSIMALQGEVRKPGLKLSKRQKDELIVGFATVRNAHRKFRDSLLKSDPYFFSVANASLMPVFDVEENPKNYHNAGVYFANEYFSKLDWKMREMDYMNPLWENVITYTRTLCSMPESFMRQDSVSYYLDKLLEQPKKNSRAYRLTLTGIMRGLLDQQSVMFSKYAEMYAKQYPEETEINQQNKQRLTQLKEQENTQKKWITGAVPPDISLQTIDGKTVTLSSLKGKTVLLYFGGSSFVPSRRLNAQLVFLYRKYQPKGFEIYQVCIEKDKAAWQKSLSEDKIYWNAVSDLKFWESEVVQTYNVKAIPTTYLLDIEGKIIAKNVLGQELQSKLESIYQVKKIGAY